MGEFPAPLYNPERLEVVEGGKIFPCFHYIPLQRKIVFGNRLDNNIFTDSLDLETIKKHCSIVQKHFTALARCVAEYEPDAIYRAFTAFFVSPNIMVTARHCLEKQPYGMKPGRIFFQNVDGYITKLPPLYIVKHSAGRLEVLDECPVEVIKDIETGVGDVEAHDFAFLKVVKWTPPDPNSPTGVTRPPHTCLFPSVVIPEVDNYIYSIQFNGRVDDGFVEKHGDENLKKTVQSGVFLSLLLSANEPSLSAGRVKVVKPPLMVAYGSSTLPGSSGAPAFSENDLGHFCSVHLGGVDTKANMFVPHTSNNGCLVADPFFQAAYARHVPADFAGADGLLEVPQEVKDYIAHKFE